MTIKKKKKLPDERWSVNLGNHKFFFFCLLSIFVLYILRTNPNYMELNFTKELFKGKKSVFKFPDNL